MTLARRPPSCSPPRRRRSARRARSAPDAPGRPFGEVTRGSEVGTGIFTVYFKRDSVYLSLSPRQLDRDYLLVTQISQGIGELGLDGGASVRSDLVRFHREGDRVELWVVNPHMAAAPGTPMARTVAYSFGHSVAQSFPIAAMRDTSEILINVAPFLVSDWADIGTVFQTAMAQRKLTGNVTFDDKRSSLQALRLFAANLEAEVRLTFQTPAQSRPRDRRRLPLDPDRHPLLASWSCPPTPMRPRLADERVGYFISAHQGFLPRHRRDFFVRYVNRWRLEKKNPGAALSEPVQPITYYIDRTVPVEWRPSVRAGILEWNRAFEDAGLPGRDPGARRPGRQRLERGRRPLLDGAVDRDQRLGLRHRAEQRGSPHRRDPQRRHPRSRPAWIQRWRGQSGRYVAPAAAVERCCRRTRSPPVRARRAGCAASARG